MMGEGKRFRGEKQQNDQIKLDNGLIQEYQKMLHDLSERGINRQQEVGKFRQNGQLNLVKNDYDEGQFQNSKKRVRIKRDRSPEDKCAIQLATTFFWCVSIGLLICSYQIRIGDFQRRQQLQDKIIQLAQNGSLSNRPDLIQDSDIELILPLETLEQMQFEVEIDDEIDFIIPRIEFELEGNYLELDRAFDSKTPPSNIENSGEDKYTEQYLVDQSYVRMFLGVTSECCSERSALRRQGVRESWFKVAQQHLNVDAKFILAQPDPDKVKIPQALKALSEEILTQASTNITNTSTSTDMVIIPGKDTYLNLPNKTIRLFTYALSSSKNYTHILKTDDDCYVRVNQLYNSMHNKFENIYTGCVESRMGFMPVRNPDSKWYLSQERLPDKYVPWGVRYVAGWGYVLSRDVAGFFLQRIRMYRRNPDIAPKWFAPLDWEDVLVGLVVTDKVGFANDHAGFKPGWKACTNSTLIKHLDFDSPLLLPGLYEQDVSKLWDNKTVQCNTGLFVSANWKEWYDYRSSLTNVLQI